MASKELNELLPHADQLFDENNFKGAIDLLKSFPVGIMVEILISFVSFSMMVVTLVGD